MLTADRLLTVLWRRRLTVVLAFSIVLGTVAAVTFVLPKVYTGSTYLWVTSTRESGNDFEATQTNQVLTKTYAELMQTRGVAAAVSAALPFQMTPSEILESVNISPVTQSQLIRITAESNDRAEARILADTFAQVFLSRIVTLNNETGTSSRVTLAEPASVDTDPIRPRPLLYLLVGAVVAAFTAALAALLRERLDEGLEIDSSTTDILGLPILARVPELPSAAARERTAPTDAMRWSDAFRLFLANLAFANDGEQPRSLAVVSSSEYEGKSTCCIELASAAAELNLRVALVDADLRRPRVSSLLGSEGGPGLSNLLRATEPIAISDVTLSLDGTGVTIVPSGPVPANPAALLTADRLGGFEKRMRHIADLTVFDTPPLSVGPDASLIAARTEATVLVLDARRTRRSSLVRAVEQLRRTRANVLGVVVNRLSDDTASSYHYQSRSPSADASGNGEQADSHSRNREGPGHPT